MSSFGSETGKNQINTKTTNRKLRSIPQDTQWRSTGWLNSPQLMNTIRDYANKTGILQHNTHKTILMNLKKCWYKEKKDEN